MKNHSEVILGGLAIVLMTFLLLLTMPLIAGEILNQPAGEQVLFLLKNYKDMGPLLIGVMLVGLLVQMLKSDLLKTAFQRFKYKRLLIVCLGQIYGIVHTLLSVESLSWGAVANAVFVGLVSSSGAAAMYEAWKGTKKLAKDQAYK